MKWDWSFPRQISLALTGSFLIAAYPFAAYGDREIFKAVIAGAALSTFNIMLGYIAIEYAFSKSMTTFTNTVIGGMGFRLLLLLAAMLFLVAGVHLHTAALTISLFYFYAVYLVLEILYIQKKVLTKTSDDAKLHG